MYVWGMLDVQNIPFIDVRACFIHKRRPKSQQSIKYLSHKGRNRMATVCRHFQIYFRVVPNRQINKKTHWFRSWLGATQATSHYLSQWWFGLLTHTCVTRPRNFNPNTNIFSKRKCIWDCRQQHVDHFLQASMCWHIRACQAPSRYLINFDLLSIRSRWISASEILLEWMFSFARGVICQKYFVRVSAC